MSEHIKVSILCLAFNQAKYIEQAIDSFLMQETNFDFEILINDDASTDGTKEIIKRYQKKYPAKIKPVFHESNQYSKGKRNFMLRYLIPRARGEYLAVCEGDDYWTDPKKLQKQVSYLEKNQDYALCFHPVRVVYENGEQPDALFPAGTDPSKFNLEELLKNNFIQTNSVMYRKQNYENMNLGVMPGDWYLHLYHAQYGKIGFMNEVMAVYRKHPGGIWWKSTNRNDQDDIWKKHGLDHMALYTELLRIYGNNKTYKKIINNHIEGTINILSRIDESSDSELISKLFKDGVASDQNSKLFSSLASILYKNYKKIERQNNTIQEKDNALKDLLHRNAELEKEYVKITEQQQALLDSRTYRIGKFMTAPFRVLKRSINR